MACLDETYRAVNEVIMGSSQLMKMIGHASPTLAIYGSTVNSLASQEDSDLDLTLLIDDFKTSHELILRLIQQELNTNPRFKCNEAGPKQIQSGFLLEVTDRMNRVEIDICVNKTLEVLNSQLVCTYGAYDIRFIKLGLFLKAWNKQHFRDKMKRLNSFSIYMMLIAFLQHRGILPNLQALAPEPAQYMNYQLHHRNWEYVGSTDTSFVKLEQFAELVDHPRFYETMNGSVASGSQFSDSVRDQKGFGWGANTDAITTGQLLLEFFEFYGYTFENEKFAIDIRHRVKLPGCSTPKPSPFRPRQDFIDEAKHEL